MRQFIASIICSLLIIAPCAVAEKTAIEPFTAPQLLELEKQKSEFALKLQYYDTKLDQLKNDLGSQEKYGQGVLQSGQQSIDKWLALLSLILAAAVFSAWRAKEKIQREWQDQRNTIENQHQAVIADLDKAKTELERELRDSLAQSHNKIKELHEAVLYARQMQNQIADVHKAVTVISGSATPEETQAALAINKAQASTSATSALVAKAMELQEEHNWDAAAVLWKSLTLLDQSEASYLFNYAYALGETKSSHEEICNAYEKCKKLRPNNPAILNNWGLELRNWANILTGDLQQQRFTEANEKFAEATHLSPAFGDAFLNWGITLANWAMTLPDILRQQCFSDANQKFEEASRLLPDDDEVYMRWGLMLMDWANLLTSEEQQQCFIKADQKFSSATSLQANNKEAWSNWGASLIYWANTLTGEAQQQRFNEAIEKCVLAGELGYYNLACIYTRQGNLDESQRYLELTEKAGNLPSRTHLKKDADLLRLHELPWFKDLLARAKA